MRRLTSADLGVRGGRVRRGVRGGVRGLGTPEKSRPFSSTTPALWLEASSVGIPVRRRFVMRMKPHMSAEVSHDLALQADAVALIVHAVVRPCLCLQFGRTTFA